MLKRANIQWSAKTLHNQIKNGKVHFDCAVQRGLVWDIDKKSLLIHSMIEGYPIPAFYFAKRDDGTYDALDGKQRSNAISSFVSGEYALQNIPPITDDDENESDVNGMTFEFLPEWAQDRIKDYSLTIYYFDGITEDEVSELFFRINNGKPLSAVELTRVKAKSLLAFQRMAKSELIQNVTTEKGRAKYNDENEAMQMWAICFAERPDFSTKAFRALIESADVTEEQEHSICEAMEIVWKYISRLDSESEKYRIRKMKSRTHIVSAVYMAYKAPDRFEHIANKFFLNESRQATCDDEYNRACKAGTAREESVACRIKAIDNAIQSDLG